MNDYIFSHLSGSIAVLLESNHDINMLKNGQGDAMVSAGSTGALLSGATLVVKRVKGIRRAALAPVIPVKNGSAMIIDCGANTECTPEYAAKLRKEHH